ncbi:MAG TPA: glycosyltransferase, partial [Solirubrobacteraceae bacterium]|nr:glycosyltransferase [Solirubrobacteraceae bacterium]
AGRGPARGGRMRLSIVVVAHESAGDLPPLLGSIARHLGPASPQVIVVDAASRDGSAEVAAAHGAEVVRLGHNAGFGAANDAGVARARAPVTVLLNPDCELVDDSLAVLAGRAAGRDALLVPRLLGGDRAPQRSAHPRPGTPAGVARALLPVRLLPVPLRERLEPWRGGRPRRVGWAIAACVVAQTALLRRLGPFDPRAFLFYEDLDLCLRAAAAGVPTELRPEAVVVHHGGRSTARAFGGEAFDLQARRRREVVGARLGPRALAWDDAAQALTFGLRAAVGRERPRNLARLRALRRARRGGADGVGSRDRGAGRKGR